MQAAPAGSSTTLFSFTGEAMARFRIRSGKARRQGFLRDERGVALVEFALTLPMMLIVFAMIVEGSRMMWSYQTVIAGVRDATRYLARITPANICSTGGSVSASASTLLTIVRQGGSGSSVIPTDVSVPSVTPSYSCTTGTYRNSPVAVAQVVADVQINLPFAGIFSLFGSVPATLNTTVTEQSRIFGS